jgi:polysaccharide biosynthesis transport protein
MDEIAQYWLVLKRRWLPAALVFALTTAVVAAWTYNQPKIFQAKGQVILKKTNKTTTLLSNVASLAGGGSSDLDTLTGSTPVATQGEILKSLTTVNGTLAELCAAPDKEKPKECGGKYKNKPKELERIKKFMEHSDTFVQQLKVSNVKGTDILEISFQDPSKELAQDVVEKIMEVYIRDDQTNQRRDAEAARNFVSKELPKIEAEVKLAESELRKFKEEYNIVDLPTESVKAVETITTLNKEITTASAQLAAETSRLQNLKALFGGRDAQTTIQSGLVSESPGLQKSLKELQEVEAKIAIEKTRFTDSDTSIVNLKEKRQALVEILQKRYKQSLIGDNQPAGNKIVELQPSGIQGNLIADYAKSEAQRTSLQKQISALVFVVDAYKKRMSALPKLEQQQNALGRKLETTRTSYKTLLSKLQEIQIAENQTLGNSRVQTHAELPQEPISPKKGQNIAIGSFLGLFLGAATAFLLDSADKRIKTSEEAKNLLPGYPILGQIPVFEKARQLPKLGKGNTREPGQLVLTGMTNGIEGESFRMLQTNLQFLNADDSLKVIVVSSSQSGEGKSTVAANLALAVAELGKKVLLVDADMRKPAQHLIWRQGNYEGLSNILSGQCDQKAATTEVQPNLFLITAGVVPPNPVVLIDSVQMSTLISQWSQEYGLVIIDAPPLTVAADAAILGTQAGGLVFVLRPGIADKESVEYAQEILTQSKLKVLGMVLNGVDLDKQSRYNHYYYSTAQATKGDEGSTGSKLLAGSTTNRTR